MKVEFLEFESLILNTVLVAGVSGILKAMYLSYVLHCKLTIVQYVLPPTLAKNKPRTKVVDNHDDAEINNPTPSAPAALAKQQPSTSYEPSAPGTNHINEELSSFSECSLSSLDLSPKKSKSKLCLL